MANESCGQCSDGTDQSPRRPDQELLRRSNTVLKTPFLRLKVLENKGISESWNHATTAENKRNSTEKSPGQKSIWLSHSARTANESGRRAEGGSGNLRRLREFGSISSRDGSGCLRRLLRRSYAGIHERLRVAGFFDGFSGVTTGHANRILTETKLPNKECYE